MEKDSAEILVTVSNAILENVRTRSSVPGTLTVQCVTIPADDLAAGDGQKAQVFVILRIGSLEVPIDPLHPVERLVSKDGVLTYYFCSGDGQPMLLSLDVAGNADITTNEDSELFEAILSQCVDLRSSLESHPADTKFEASVREDSEDLRGRLVFVNEDTGKIIGTVDGDGLSMTETSTLGSKGEPVLVDITEDEDGNVCRGVVSAAPPDQRDWMVQSASYTSHFVSTGTNFLVSAVETASSYYISHTKPLPSRSSSAPSVQTFLSSDSTRQGLTGMHSVSGKVAQLGKRTIDVIDNKILQAMGGRPKANSQVRSSPAVALGGGAQLTVQSPPLPPCSRPSSPDPPPYTEKPLPPLPSRKPLGSPQASNSILTERTASSSSPSSSAAPTAQRQKQKLSTVHRLAISANLLLEAVDDATLRLIDAGSHAIEDVVAHRYGAPAGANAALLTHSARNIAVVYYDMQGIGRRALLRRAGVAFVKAKMKGTPSDAERGNSA